MNNQIKEQIKQKKICTKKYITWAVVAVSVGLIGYLLVSSSNKPENVRPGVAFGIQGQQHVADGASHGAYNSNPPTSGWHLAQAVSFGVYDKELSDEQLIHSIEHGGIWISYKDVDSETKLKLVTLAEKYPGSVILTPRLANDSKIALASWGRLEKLEIFDEQAIINFIKANTNKSPEPFAR